MISGLLKIIGLFCKRALLKRLYSAKATYSFKEPTNRSHPIRIRCNSLQTTATYCNSLQHTHRYREVHDFSARAHRPWHFGGGGNHMHTLSNTLQYTATHCNTHADIERCTIFCTCLQALTLLWRGKSSKNGLNLCKRVCP